MSGVCIGKLAFGAFVSLSLLSFKKDSLRVIDRLRSVTDKDVRRDKDLAGIAGASSSAFDNEISSDPSSVGASSAILADIFGSTLLVGKVGWALLPAGGCSKFAVGDVVSTPVADDTGSTLQAAGAVTVPLVDELGSKSLSDDFDFLPLCDGFDLITFAEDIGSAPFKDETDLPSLRAAASTGLLVDLARSELVTRTTGSTLMADVACSGNCEADPFCFELFPEVFSREIGLFEASIEWLTGLGAWGRGL